jgi:phytoene desaturase
MAGRWGPLRELWDNRRLMRFMVGPMAATVSEFARPVQAPWLRVLLENLFLPTVPTYFVCMLLAMLADGQLGLLEGGCHDFVAAMEQRYRQLGGEITYRATAAEILIAQPQARGLRPRACGVRLQDGRELPAGAVISAADGQSTLFEMLPGRFLTRAIVNRYARWQTFPPLMMISFGVNRSFAGEPAFQALNLERPLQVAGKPVLGLFLRIFNYGPGFAPAGKCVLQVEFETEWDYWHDLRVRDKAAYESAKAEVAAMVLGCLETHYPGLASHVDVRDVATPYTTWRYTLNRRGAWEGWQITPAVMMTAIERTLPGLDGFCMAGQWVMPGGGVPPVLYSGRHAVQLLCRRDGRRFAGDPDMAPS